jgi:glucan phosphoethanolaminetransferase (alkaline phosphatase superfamily)
MENRTFQNTKPNTPPKGRGFSTRRQSEWIGSMILVIAFLPLTLPNLWAGKWRHSLFQLALWLAIIGNRRWSVLMMIPFYLATPILIFVTRHYGPADLNLLASLRGCTLSEKTAFFQIIPAGCYWLYSLMLVPILAYMVLPRLSRSRTTAKVRWACLFIALGFVSVWGSQAYRSRLHGGTLFESIVIRHIGSYQPFGLLISSTLAGIDADGEREAARQRAEFTFDASSVEKLDNVVFVIGESSRADHWHLNGYSRATTPKLDQVQNLISFSNVLSLAPNTVLSWPFIFTPKVAGDSTHWPTQKSLITAFKEAGYSTCFVSFYMDQQSPRRDPLAIIAFEADNVVNGLAGAGRKSTDVAMLPAIRQILAKKGPKLTVVSTQGSHTGFEAELPSEYDFFQPSALNGIRTPEGWRNGYDNTIRMTDDFLAAIIQQLQGSRSVLFYVSDHGLACYDKQEMMLGQAFVKPEYRPACLAWASKEFLDGVEARTRFDTGRQHAGSPITTAHIMDSLLDLCGIQTKIQNRSKSLFSVSLVPPVKWQVEDFQGRWLDYAQVPDSVK